MTNIRVTRGVHRPLAADRSRRYAERTNCSVWSISAARAAGGAAVPRSTFKHMSRIDVQTEVENAQSKCWDYTVVVEDDAGHASSHQVRLSWLDHEHWSGGRVPPSKVIEAVLECLLSHGMKTTLPERFDAARARRWIPGIDRELQAAI